MLSLMVAICVGIGLLLLIVPGIILFVRWSLAVPILIDRAVPTADAVALSWAQTAGHFGPILAIFTLVYAPGLLLFGASFMSDADAAPNLLTLILSDILLEASLIAGWTCAVAAYSMITEFEPLSQIFE
jgi:hypothetical protein